MIYTVVMAIDTIPTMEAPARHRRETASSGCWVGPLGGGRWQVHSPSGRTYLVCESDDRLVCECPSGVYRRSQEAEPCKHIAAVWLSCAAPSRILAAIRDDLLAEAPDIPHALALAEMLSHRAVASPDGPRVSARV